MKNILHQPNVLYNSIRLCVRKVSEAFNQQTTSSDDDVSEEEIQSQHVQFVNVQKSTRNIIIENYTGMPKFTSSTSCEDLRQAVGGLNLAGKISCENLDTKLFEIEPKLSKKKFRKALDRLVQRAEKYGTYDPEDSLPGDMTKKYCLKYHEPSPVKIPRERGRLRTRRAFEEK